MLRLVLSLILFAVSAAAETYAFMMLSLHNLPIHALILHLVAVAAVHGGIGTAYRSPLIDLAIPVGFCLPIFGIAGLITLALFWKIREDSQREAYLEYREYIKHNIISSRRFETINVEEEIARKLDIEPVIDILSSSKKNLVWGSIEVLSRMSDEKAVELIRKTMSRSDMDYKFFASWGIDRIERHFLKNLANSNLKFQVSPSLGNLINVVQLALKYIDSRLIDGILAKNLLSDILEKITDFGQKYPDLSETHFLRGLIVSRLDTTEGCSILRNALAKSNPPTIFLVDISEAFFKAGDFSSIRKVVGMLISEPSNEKLLLNYPYDVNLDELQNFWSKSL
ncbi:MAG: hypothetical protein HQM10_13995 [Candidatus Riflebacteria bacterium]|nr:hypothetical protein [Candidatus Riflebacteria bacterium]